MLIARDGRNIRTNLGLGLYLGYGRSDYKSDHIPMFVWRFCPPEFKDFAPEGITPGTEDRGPKLLSPAPAGGF